MTDATCDICLNDVSHDDARRRIDGDVMCGRCRAWHEYWESLSPDERAAEIRAMDRYASERTDP